jgi:hypothetical protein
LGGWLSLASDVKEATLGERMKITFRGLSREIFPHQRETNLKWRTATEASGTLKNLGLNGNFRVNFQFQIEELEQWLAKYLEADPAGALRLASRVQAEAICALASASKSKTNS